MYSAGVPKFVDSEPIAITVEEPIGEDLEVWNRIKNDGKFAFFIQVEDILQKYPRSIYAAPLRRSLEKFESRKTFRRPPDATK